jgi:hypothetical protein
MNNGAVASAAVANAVAHSQDDSLLAKRSFSGNRPDAFLRHQDAAGCIERSSGAAKVEAAPCKNARRDRGLSI